jgi:hypothetical protein
LARTNNSFITHFRLRKHKYDGSMEYYKVKASMITGVEYGELVKKARVQSKKIASTSKRQPYVRSRYYKNKKVFIASFWDHLNQKSKLDRTRRVKLFPCAIELIRDSTKLPEIKQNPKDSGQVLYRFFGVTPSGQRFCVQISEDKKTSKRFFMSVFPA